MKCRRTNFHPMWNCREDGNLSVAARISFWCRISRMTRRLLKASGWIGSWMWIWIWIWLLWGETLIWRYIYRGGIWDWEIPWRDIKLDGNQSFDISCQGCNELFHRCWVTHSRYSADDSTHLTHRVDSGSIKTSLSISFHFEYQNAFVVNDTHQEQYWQQELPMYTHLNYLNVYQLKYPFQFEYHICLWVLIKHLPLARSVISNLTLVVSRVDRYRYTENRYYPITSPFLKQTTNTQNWNIRLVHLCKISALVVSGVDR